MKKNISTRKTIGICVSGFNIESDSKAIAGIAEKCLDDDVNLLIFSSLLLKGDYPKNIGINSNLVRGETEIFNLINYDLVDGLILFGESFYKKEVISEIEKKCEEHNVPIVNVNDPSHILKHNVFVRNTYAMELVVDHLVTVHGLTKINFIGGYPDNKETLERLSAYKKILTKNNIPIEEDRIAYGHFWKQSVECAKQFIEKGLPEAIVCANDTMAIMVCDYLKNQGYRIPQDIIVTGYDGTLDAEEYDPSLTTVRPDYKNTGVKAYELLCDLIDGNDDLLDPFIDSELLIHESCGCVAKKPNFNFIDYKYSELDLMKAINKSIVKSNILCADSRNSTQLFESLTTGLEFFWLNRLYFCINSELEKKTGIYFSHKNKHYGISEKMICMGSFNANVPAKTEFKTAELLPENVLNEEKPVVISFSPLYYRNSFLGYTALESKQIQDQGELFSLWSSNTQNQIGSFYLQEELSLINLTDPLTSLYNRRGMMEKFEQVYESFSEKKEYVTIICADIDNLKIINDKYGHEGGDIAITQVAAALKSSFPENSICVRTGGDEYCILLHSEKKPTLSKYVEAVDRYLDDFNKDSKLPYKITCSCGSFTLSTKEFTSFEEMQKAADAKMYKVKEKHHNLHK